MNQLDTDQRALQEVNLSQFKTQLVQPRVDEWENKLAMVSEVIDEWLLFQKTWIFLELLYNNNHHNGESSFEEEVSAKLSLSEDGDDFGTLDSFFREVMYRTNLNRNVLMCTFEEG